MAGLIGIGRKTANTAMAGMSVAADGEYSRNQAQKQIDDATEAQKMNTIGNAAGYGAQFGLSDRGGEMMANAFGKNGSVTQIPGMGSAGLPEANVFSVDQISTFAESNGLTGMAQEQVAEQMLTEGVVGEVALEGAAAEAGMAAGPMGAMLGLGIGLLMTELF